MPPETHERVRDARIGLRVRTSDEGADGAQPAVELGRHVSDGEGARAIHAVVRGRVQGVGFRYSTESAARRLRLAGWVRNMPDGSVEVWAQGAAAAVDALLALLREGPRHAAVTTVDVARVEVDPALREFDVRF